MMNGTEQATATIDSKFEGYQNHPITPNDNDEDAIERKYEKLRDDQTNTGVIAALLGGFALTNSWEMEVSDESTTNQIAAYSLAILAVHACTCSALVSAFLYRQLTQQATSKKGLQWMKRHAVLQNVPWYKFLVGTLCYVVSVCLVAWSSLEITITGRIVTLVGGFISCSVVLYTCWVIYSDSDPEENNDSKQHKTHSINNAPRRIR